MEKLGSALIVDDEEDALEVLSLCVAELGFDVVTAADGREAMEKCRQQKFALVITDLMMPDVDGLEFVERLRTVDADVPVFLVTGAPSNPSLSAAAGLGVCEYVVKPFSGKDIQRRILLTVKAQRARSAS